MEIKNKREDLYASELPPKILSEDDVEEIAGDAGFVKNTDYASTNTGGVIKISATYGTAISNGGALYGVTKTAEQYGTADNRVFINKGTLENVIQALVKRELIALLGGVDTDETGTTLTDWFAERTADGWNIAAVKATPTPPTP